MHVHCLSEPPTWRHAVAADRRPVLPWHPTSGFVGLMVFRRISGRERHPGTPGPKGGLTERDGVSVPHLLNDLMTRTGGRPPAERAVERAGGNPQPRRSGARDNRPLPPPVQFIELIHDLLIYSYAHRPPLTPGPPMRNPATPRPVRAFVPFALVLAFSGLLTACGSGDARRWTGTVDTLASREIVVHNAADPPLVHRRKRRVAVNSSRLLLGRIP